MKRVILALWLIFGSWACAEEPLLELGSRLPPGSLNVIVSPDGERVLSWLDQPAGEESTLELWRVKDGRRLARLDSSNRKIDAMFLPGNGVAAVVTSLENNKVQVNTGLVWDATGKLKAKKTLSFDVCWLVKSGCLGPDSLALACSESNEVGDDSARTTVVRGRLYSWHWPTGKIDVFGPTIAAWIVQCQVSPDRRWLGLRGGDGGLVLWDLRSSRVAAKTFQADEFAWTGRSDRIRIGTRLCSLPTLTRLSELPSMVTALSGDQTYRLNPPSPQCLDRTTLKPVKTARLRAAAHFRLADCSVAGALPRGRVLLWDAVHHCSAILDSGKAL